MSSAATAKFNYSSLDHIIADCDRLNICLPFSLNPDLFKKKVDIGAAEATGATGAMTIPNSIGYHPMEGCDGNADGSPGELTFRKYARFARGGAGLMWFEAVAISEDAKAVSGQLWLNKNNVGSFSRLADEYLNISRVEFGEGFRPVTIMQLTHSGRFCNPYGESRPLIAYDNPYFKGSPKDKDEGAARIVTDDELERLEDAFADAAELACKAGFDGVDMKACHSYLASELLSAFTRKGRYGGDFEGRTRFLLNTIDKIRSRLGSHFIIATRLNAYDGIPYPYGWGVDKHDHRKYDLEEPNELIRLLSERGVRLINLTMGTPYNDSHENEHPLEGIARMVNCIGEIQTKNPNVKVVGTGYSWLRQFSANLAAGCLEKGYVSIAGFGRQSLAYPEFPKELLQNRDLRSDKCCISCGKCAELLKAGQPSGCVVRDHEVFAPIYKKVQG